MAAVYEMKNLSRVIIPIGFQSEATAPPLPHFDDEATLLTARAVVPIDVAAASQNRRNYLIQAAVILVAALLGAAVAVSFDFFRNRQAVAATAVVETPAPAPETAVSEELDTSQPRTPQSNDSAAATPTTKPSSTAGPSELSERPAIKTKEKMPASERDRDKAADPDRAARRNVAEKPSERASQRLAARERRAGEGNQIAERPREAGRIREIFEGPRPF